MFGQLGRFHNIMSNETIGTLAFLTSGQVEIIVTCDTVHWWIIVFIHPFPILSPEIRGIFVHPFLAERIISMLNYFLQHLVGPKMGALKVKDFSEFDFKPQQLVSDICTIYLNLGYVVALSFYKVNKLVDCKKKRNNLADCWFFFLVFVYHALLLVPCSLEEKKTAAHCYNLQSV